MIAVGAVWQIAYAPYVSDYSRYMPAGSGARAAFWATYGGTVISAVLVMTLGCLVGAVATGDDVIGGLASLTGALSTTVLLAFAAVSALGNACRLSRRDTDRPEAMTACRTARKCSDPVELLDPATGAAEAALLGLAISIQLDHRHNLRRVTAGPRVEQEQVVVYPRGRARMQRQGRYPDLAADPDRNRSDPAMSGSEGILRPNHAADPTAFPVTRRPGQLVGVAVRVEQTSQCHEEGTR